MRLPHFPFATLRALAHRNDKGGRGQASPLQAGQILSTKYEMLNNIEAQKLNDQNVRVLNLEH
jgi:hypothetical protein